jgi:hypothetical protein
MLHACFTPIALCLVYTSWHFYAFSKINLLTRCHTAISLFFAVFCVSEKLHRKYSRNWTKQSLKFLFCPRRHGVQRGDGVGPGGRHTIGWCTPLWPRHQVVWPLLYVDPNSIRRLTTERSEARRWEACRIVAAAYIYSL